MTMGGSTLRRDATGTKLSHGLGARVRVRVTSIMTTEQILISKSQQKRLLVWLSNASGLDLRGH